MVTNVMMKSTTTTTTTTTTRKVNKINKNYTSAIFPESERYELYHKIEGYPSVKRFIDKRGRGSKKTAALYKTGLVVLEKYLQYKYKFSIETMVEKLRKNKLDIYTMIESFVNFLLTDLHKTPNTANVAIKAITSFCRSERLSLDPRLVSESASIPRSYRDTESDFALDKATASKILSAPMKRRLRVFLYTLASSGTRVGELSAIKWTDINFNTNPVSIHLPAWVTKTKVGRTVYVTKETAEELRQWLQYKQRCRSTITRYRKNVDANNINMDNEYVFQVYDKQDSDPKYIVHEIQTSFTILLKSLGLYNVRKGYGSDNNNSKNNDDKNDKSEYARGTITLHSFRKLYKTLISLHAKEAELSEYLLGHRSTLNQTYFKISPSDVAKIYLERCEKYLTFNDVAGLETDLLSVSKQNETLAQKLIQEREEKDRELRELKERLSAYENKLDKFDQIQKQIDDIRTKMIQKMDEREQQQEDH